MATKVISPRKVWRDENGVKHVEPKVIECKCGQHVLLQFDGVECECGQNYNIFGQRILPRSAYIAEGSYWDQ